LNKTKIQLVLPLDDHIPFLISSNPDRVSRYDSPIDYLTYQLFLLFYSLIHTHHRNSNKMPSTEQHSLRVRLLFHSSCTHSPSPQRVLVTGGAGYIGEHFPILMAAFFFLCVRD
jgi:hypothetical protein